MENGNLSEDFLKIWLQLPMEIQSDSDVAFVQNQYNHTSTNIPDTDPENINRLTTDLFEQILNDNQQFENKQTSKRKKCRIFFRSLKDSLLILCWIAFFVPLLITKNNDENLRQIIVDNNNIINLTLMKSISSDRIGVTIEGSLFANEHRNINNSLSEYYLTVWIEALESTHFRNDLFDNGIKNLSTTWTIPLVSFHPETIPPLQKKTKVFLLNFPERLPDHHLLSLKFKSNVNVSLPFIVSYNESPIDTENGVWYGAALLIGLYILIISEVVHKTIGAILASTSSLAVLAALKQKATMMEILSWIDIDTLLLLFSMMMLVAVISETGIFDYLAVYAYKITKGDVWSLLCTLCLFTAITSAFLDNVTIILLLTPVTIRLCEVIQLNPVPILTTMVIFSNIGGGATPVGDPPNVIIASNHDVINANINFGIFTVHMSLGMIIVLFVMYGHFRFVFRNIDVLRSNTERQDLQALQHRISIWKEAADRLPRNSRDEILVNGSIVRKINYLEDELAQKTDHTIKTPDDFESTLKDLQKKYPIKKKWLLAKSGFSITFVLVLFFFHSLPQFNLSLGWTAFMGVLLLLVLANDEDFDNILTKVEWGTLLFFAALFVMIEVLSKLGLIAWIGKQTEFAIMTVNEEYRLTVGILLIVWISAIAGALFDNVPLITMLIRIIIGLSENQDLKIPLQPLIWALAFGACLGGNGTLIGATANVVCAGVAEQHGYHLTFMQFFKLGFPAMITSNLTITIYLIVSHAVFDWNY
ncbi:P protein-like isoform X2 [Phymastichus coffea]|nr:P protein-like isoform X2 [Phymastichus coffea]